MAEVALTHLHRSQEVSASNKCRQQLLKLSCLCSGERKAFAQVCQKRTHEKSQLCCAAGSAIGSESNTDWYKLIVRSLLQSRTRTVVVYLSLGRYVSQFCVCAIWGRNVSILHFEFKKNKKDRLGSRKQFLY